MRQPYISQALFHIKNFNKYLDIVDVIADSTRGDTSDKAIEISEYMNNIRMIYKAFNSTSNTYINNIIYHKNGKNKPAFNNAVKKLAELIEADVAQKEARKARFYAKQKGGLKYEQQQ